jgi:transcriptional regulator with XRE-family HTH domain
MSRDRIGADVRLLRVRKRWRQSDLATRAGCSQSEISRIERGLVASVPLGRLALVAEALGARLATTVLWQGERLDRLRDERHARLVETVARRLHAHGWNVRPEVSFSVFGERGSIDLLAFHRATRMLLVVEVKTAFGDVQETLATLDRKERLAARIARDNGWRPSNVSTLLAVAEGSTNRRVVDQHRATFGAAFPIRGRAAGRHVAEPGESRFRALAFMSGSHGRTVRSTSRVRRPSAGAERAGFVRRAKSDRSAATGAGPPRVDR